MSLTNKQFVEQMEREGKAGLALHVVFEDKKGGAGVLFRFLDFLYYFFWLLATRGKAKFNTIEGMYYAPQTGVRPWGMSDRHYDDVGSLLEGIKSEYLDDIEEVSEHLERANPDMRRSYVDKKSARDVPHDSELQNAIEWIFAESSVVDDSTPGTRRLLMINRIAAELLGIDQNPTTKGDTDRIYGAREYGKVGSGGHNKLGKWSYAFGRDQVEQHLGKELEEVRLFKKLEKAA